DPPSLEHATPRHGQAGSPAGGARGPRPSTGRLTSSATTGSMSHERSGRRCCFRGGPMQSMTWGFVVVAFTLPPAAAPAPAAPPPTDAEVKGQVRRLGQTNDKAARLKALKWLNGNRGAGNAGLAVPGLERCVREDPEGEVRRDAVLALG